MQRDLLVITSIPPTILGRSQGTQDFGHATDTLTGLHPRCSRVGSWTLQYGLPSFASREATLHSHLIHDLMHLVNGREVMVASKEGLQRRRANAPGAPRRLLQRVRARRKASLPNCKASRSKWRVTCTGGIGLRRAYR